MLPWVAAASVVGAAIVAIRRSRGVAADAARRRRAVLELCDALGAELAGGMPAASALEHACGVSGEWSAVVSTSRLGGDAVGRLRSFSAAPGAAGLGAVAAAWQVSAQTGAPLADVLDQVAAGLRHDEEARLEVSAALAPPRATARLLAVLPLFGLALGASMGARPLDFLLGTGPGRLCLAVGVALAVVGVAWVERLANGAEAA